MPERQWKQIVRDTAEKSRKDFFGKIPDYIKDSPQWLDWEKKYSPKQIMNLLESVQLPWEKKMEQIALGDPIDRLGDRFEEILKGNTDAN